MTDAYGVYAPFYDLDLGSADSDLLFIQESARRTGSPILELACGTGRVLLPLAHAGFDVTGVDVSPAMLDVARRKVAEAGLEEQVTLVEQDMRTLALDRRFNMILIAANSFSHLLTLEDQLQTLARVRAHLEPGGLLLLDLFNPDLARLLDFRGQLILDKVMEDPQTGRQVTKLRSEEVDLGEQVINVTYFVDEMDDEGTVRRTLFPFSMRYLFRYELELLLRQAGLQVEAVYGSYNLDPFEGNSEKLLAVARRRAQTDSP